MNFKDEEIIRLRNSHFKKQFANTATGMYAGNQFYCFQRQELFENYAMDVPEGFAALEAEDIEKRYPSKDRPQLVIGERQQVIDFTFSCFQEAMPFENQDSAMAQFKLMIQAVQPANQFLQQGVISTPDFSTITWMDFKSYALDGAIYNLLFIIPGDGQWLLGMFHCPYSVWGIWRPVMLEMITTISRKETSYDHKG